MKILHISKEERVGGAGIAAFRLSQSMNECGLESRMLVLCDNGNLDENTSAVLTGSIAIKLYKLKLRLIQRLKIRRFKQTFTVSFGVDGHDVSKHPLVKDSDVIFVHWINYGMLNLKNLSSLLDLGKPVFFYCHDMWLLSGGCHHVFDCDKYRVGCHDCPLCSDGLFQKLVDHCFAGKKKHLAGYGNMHIVTPSHWLASCMEGSALFKGKDVDVVPNLVDTEIFRPLDKDKCREELSLPDSSVKLILFVANGGHANPIKGWSYLIESLKAMKRDGKTEVVVVGSELSEEDAAEIPMKVHSLGVIRDPQKMCKVYNAADVFAMPSLAENFPLTILESMACGTPVTAFNVGGIPDQVATGNTGYLADYKNSDDFANGLEYCIDKMCNENCSQVIRDITVSQFSASAVVEQHKKLIERYASL